MSQIPAQRPASGRHRPRPFERQAVRPAALVAAYRAAHPARLRAIGRSETRRWRTRLAAARELDLAMGGPLEVTW